MAAFKIPEKVLGGREGGGPEVFGWLDTVCGLRDRSRLLNWKKTTKKGGGKRGESPN